MLKLESLCMDKRKGLIAAYRKLGPFNKFLFWLVIFGIISTIIVSFIGASKKGLEDAQEDRDVKYTSQTEQMSKIDEKNDLKNRPYIGVEKFDITRNNTLLFLQDYLTLFLRNFGEVPANDLSIYLDIFDEVNIREKNKNFPFRNTVPGNFSMLPKDDLIIDKKLLNSGVIVDMEEYDRWSEEKTIQDIKRRKQYYKQHNEFPRQDIIYVKLEIRYRGIEKVNELPFSFKAIYSAELKDGKIIWTSNNSEVK